MSNLISNSLANRIISTHSSVLREDLVSLCLSALETGSVVISAPFGFGKTILARQVSDEFRRHHSNKRVIVVSLSSFNSCFDALDSLRSISCENNLSFVSLIILDDLPYFDEDAREDFEHIVSSWSEMGVSTLFTCTPFNRISSTNIAVSLELTAHDLVVKGREFEAWDSHYSYNRSSPVNLSCGIPFLLEVFAYRQLNPNDEQSLFESSIKHLIMRLLNECVTEEIKKAVFMLLCVQEGSLLDLKSYSGFLKEDLLTFLSENYPCFGISKGSRSFKTLSLSVEDLVDIGVLIEMPVDKYIHESALLCMRMCNYERAEEMWNYSRSPRLGLELVSAQPFGAAFSCSRNFLAEVYTHVDLETLSPDQLFVGFAYFRRIALKRKVREYRKYIERNLQNYPPSLICCYNLLLIIDSLSSGLTIFDHRSSGQSDKHTVLSSENALSACRKADLSLLTPFLHAEIENSEHVRSEFISQALLLSTCDVPLVVKQLWCHAAAMHAFYQGWELDIKTYLSGALGCEHPHSVLDALLLVDKTVCDQGGLISFSSKQSDLSPLIEASNYCNEQGWSDYSWYIQGVHAALYRRQISYLHGAYENTHALEKAQMVAARRSEKYYELYFSLNSAWVDLNEGNFVLGSVKTKRCFSIIPTQHTGHTWVAIYVIDMMLQIMADSQDALSKRRSEVETVLMEQKYAVECSVIQMAFALKGRNLEELVDSSQVIKDSIVNPRYKTYLIQLLMIAYHLEFYDGCEYLLSMFEKSEMITVIQSVLPELPEAYMHGLRTPRADHRSQGDPKAAGSLLESQTSFGNSLSFDKTGPHMEGRISNNPYLYVNLLGGFKLTVNGKTVSERKFGKRKALQLFVLLALRAGKEVTRTKIIEELWPGQSYYEARNSLYSCLSAVRSAIGQGKSGPEVVVASRDTIKLDMQYVTTDVQLLSEQLASLRTQHSTLDPEEILERCAFIHQLYHGEIIEVGIDSVHSEYESMRIGLKKEIVRVLTLASDAAHCCGDEALCLYYIECAYSMDRFREDLCALYMKALARNHQRAVAIDLYYRHIKTQSQELGLPASRELIDLYESIVKEAYSESENRSQEGSHNDSQKHQKHNQTIAD